MKLFYQLFLGYFETLSLLYSWERQFIPDTHCPIEIFAAAGIAGALLLSVREAPAAMPKPAKTVDSGHTQKTFASQH